MPDAYIVRSLAQQRGVDNARNYAQRTLRQIEDVDLGLGHWKPTAIAVLPTVGPLTACAIRSIIRVASVDDSAKSNQKDCLISFVPSRSERLQMKATIDGMVPWARGPFELIRHANEHLQEGGDTDRRIALIGFDNAIEVCIDVFIKLHPRLRGGLEIKQVDVDQATRNYHTKIEFLDKYRETHKLALDLSIESIVWYHSLRNELYHSGNGMVPESHVLEGARAAATSVFQALFKADISSMLGEKASKPTKQVQQMPFFAENDEMEFLRLFIEFERSLQAALPAGYGRDAIRARSPRQMWEEYIARNKVPVGWTTAMQKVLPLRDLVAHGQASGVPSDEIIEASIALMEITDGIQASTKTKAASKSAGGMVAKENDAATSQA